MNFEHLRIVLHFASEKWVNSSLERSPNQQRKSLLNVRLFFLIKGKTTQLHAFNYVLQISI